MENEMRVPGKLPAGSTMALWITLALLSWAVIGAAVWGVFL